MTTAGAGGAFGAATDPRPVSRRDRRDAIVVSTFLLGLLLLHSLLAPAYRGPDEPHHFDLAREWSLDADYDVVARQLSTQIQSSLGIVEFGSRSRNLEQAGALSRGERPRLDELGPNEPSQSYNQISQHGPAYPIAIGTGLAVIDTVEPGPRWAFDRELGAARLLSILLVTPVAGLIFLTMRVLGGRRLEAWLAGLVPLAIPQFTHINAMVNNDAMVVLVGAVLALGTAALLRTGLRWSTLVGVGLACGLGLATKALVVGPLLGAGLGLVLAWVRARPPIRRIGLHLSVLAATTILGGGWWVVRNIIEFGTPQPSGTSLLPPAPDSFEPDMWTWFDRYRSVMPRTAFGKFGWLDLSIGWAWVRAAIVVFVVALVLAVVRVIRRRARVPAPVTITELSVFLAPLAILVVLAGYQTYAAYTSQGIFSGLQGRYYFSALPFLAIVMAVGLGGVRGRLRLLVAAGALVWITTVQWKAATTMLGYYWGPPAGSLRDQIAALLSWSPWPAGVSLGFGLVAVLGGLASVVVGAWAATEPEAIEAVQSGS